VELQMMMVRISKAALVAAFIGVSVSPCTTQARPLGNIEGMPFWGHPYPYGYVYRRVPEHCIHVEQVEQFFAPPLTLVTVDCGDRPVTARY
jgi:hypothetical protein